ncbi:MAG: zincin-like metallopeptidase domain-containing protein [Hyphomicrobium sp.]
MYHANGPSPSSGIERFIAALGSAIDSTMTGEGLGEYRPDADSIGIKPPETFESPLIYYAVLLHEHGHWTGHRSRLARRFGREFGSPSYAREELIATIVSLHLSMYFGVLRDEGLAWQLDYVRGWLRRVEPDAPGARLAMRMGRTRRASSMRSNGKSWANRRTACFAASTR